MAKGKKTGGADFVKGQSGNPAGLSKADIDIQRIKRLTKEELKDTANLLLYSTPSDLVSILSDPRTPAIRAALVRIILNMIDQGNMSTMDAMLNRLIGKVKDEVDVTSTMNLGSLTDDQLDAKIALMQAKQTSTRDV